MKSKTELIPFSDPAGKVAAFKQAYIDERRILERIRGVQGKPYNPSKSLDGVSRWDTPEVAKPRNEWEVAYKKLEKEVKEVTPTRYVRVVFRILRGSALAIPELRQLASENTISLFREYYSDTKDYLFFQLKNESERAKVSINTNFKGSGYSLPLSVYYAVLDERLDLSPLFRYCLCRSAVERIHELGESSRHTAQLEDLAKRYELLAAMDYALFPDEYDGTWGSVIPADFRVAVRDKLSHC
jgi:hypothetical protein